MSEAGSWLGRISGKSASGRLQVHAYCLMSNHFLGNPT
jgi:hypothetical protein